MILLVEMLMLWLKDLDTELYLMNDEHKQWLAFPSFVKMSQK